MSRSSLHPALAFCMLSRPKLLRRCQATIEVEQAGITVTLMCEKVPNHRRHCVAHDGDRVWRWKHQRRWGNMPTEGPATAINEPGSQA